MRSVREIQIAGALVAAVALCLTGIAAAAQYGGGSGTAEDPYQIWTAEQMNAIGAEPNDWDKHFKLMADIDLSDYARDRFNLIGSRVEGHVKPFTGVFNGNGHAIANLACIHRSEEDVGLFVYVSGSDVVIQDLVLTDPNVTSWKAIGTGSLIGYLGSGMVTNCHVRNCQVTGNNNNVGGLVGCSGGTIENCSVNGSISGWDNVGGIVGRTPEGTVMNCYADANLAGNEYVGGLIGYNLAAVRNCHAIGVVSGAEYVGGLMGLAGKSVTACYATGSVHGGSSCGGLVGIGCAVITDSYAIGYVSGTFNVGGLVGDNRQPLRNCYALGDAIGKHCVGGLVGHSLCGLVTCCYSIGHVSGERYVGGLVGRDESGQVTASFWDVETSGLTVSAAGQGKRTAELQTMASFVLWGACDNAGKWMLDETRSYPTLAWEGCPGQPIVTASLSSLLPGAGTEDDPIQIATADELQAVSLFSCEWDKHFQLTADIDLSAYKKAPFVIGTEQEPFRGVFDGNGHIIAHFTATMQFWQPSDEPGPVGLFGYVSDPNAEIREVGMVDPNVEYRMPESVGSLVGYLDQGTVVHCYAMGGYVRGPETEAIGGLVGANKGLVTDCYAVTRVSGGWGGGRVGGLAGRNDGTIRGCRVSGSVWGNLYSSIAGGLVGSNTGIVTECYASGNVSAGADGGGLVGSNAGAITSSFASGNVSDAKNAGGLVGRNRGVWQGEPYIHSVSIANCYATGAVNGAIAGGLVGLNGWGQDRNVADISCCFATGLVFGETTCGGLVGTGNLAAIEFSFWDTQTTGQAMSTGGVGKSTTDMRAAETFVDAGWDFAGETANGIQDIWWIDEGRDYPRLWWEAEEKDDGTTASDD